MRGPVKPRIVIVTTSAQTLGAFFQNQIRFMSSEGFDIQTISSPGRELHECRRNTGVSMHEVAMQRRISPFADTIALLKLTRKLRRLRPDIVHTHTPKAGLLGTAAATLARVPTRIYTINGIRCSTSCGLRRALLVAADRLACLLATEVLCVSKTLGQQAVGLGICPAHKLRTLGFGASHGVDLAEFDPSKRNLADREAARARYGLPRDALVLGYIGRVVRDKGIATLAAAWKMLRKDFPELRLLLCGEVETGDPLPPAVLQELRTDPRIRLMSANRGDMPAVYAAIDICVLPSYREGLPNSVLEAQAMCLPVVTTRIPGTVDALQHGVTGLLVEPRDQYGLAHALKLLIQDPQLRQRLGAAGRAFVGQRFAEQTVSKLVAAEYRRLLASALPGKRLDPVRSRPGSPLGKALKRALDVVAASFGLVACSPLLLLIAIVLRRNTRSTAFFRQNRIGLEGRPFVLYKFRTMTEARCEDGSLLPDEQRLTALGRFLRATSLDELPQLVNVVKGEMSLVGPRPLLPEYMTRYNTHQRRRHESKPGITGWAQVNGRNALTWEQKLDFDVWYVDHQSIWLDIKILWRTLFRVFQRDGISQDGHATMPEFMGTAEVIDGHE